MIKKCPKCHIEKDIDLFNKNKSRSDGHSSYCKKCTRKYDNKIFRNFTVKQRNNKNNKAYKRNARNSQYVWDYLKEHPCIDCGEKDPIVLEFDHVRDKKINTICNMVRNGCSLETIKKEISKCVVRCANDHRRRTAKQLGFYKNIKK